MKKLLLAILFTLVLSGGAFGYTALNTVSCKIINKNVNELNHKAIISSHIASYITGRNFENDLDIGKNNTQDQLYIEFMEWCSLYPDKNNYEVLELIYEKLKRW